MEPIYVLYAQPVAGTDSEIFNLILSRGFDASACHGYLPRQEHPIFISSPTIQDPTLPPTNSWPFAVGEAFHAISIPTAN